MRESRLKCPEKTVLLPLSLKGLSDSVGGAVAKNLGPETAALKLHPPLLQLYPTN